MHENVGGPYQFFFLVALSIWHLRSHGPALVDVAVAVVVVVGIGSFLAVLVLPGFGVFVDGVFVGLVDAEAIGCAVAAELVVDGSIDGTGVALVVGVSVGTAGGGVREPGVLSLVLNTIIAPVPKIAAAIKLAPIKIAVLLF